MKRLLLPLAGAALLSCIAVPPASAQQTLFRSGTLNCNVSAGIGWIFFSQRGLGCEFLPGRHRREVYYGRISRYGFDVGFTGPGALAWTVLTTGRRYYPYSIGGVYAGGGAEATVGAGVGANLLVGGNNNSVALQPLSVQAQTGLNLGLGATTVELARGQ